MIKTATHRTAKLSVISLFFLTILFSMFFFTSDSNAAVLPTPNVDSQLNGLILNATSAVNITSIINNENLLITYTVQPTQVPLTNISNVNPNEVVQKINTTDVNKNKIMVEKTPAVPQETKNTAKTNTTTTAAYVIENEKELYYYQEIHSPYKNYFEYSSNLLSQYRANILYIISSLIIIFGIYLITNGWLFSFRKIIINSTPVIHSEQFDLNERFFLD